MQGKWCLVLSRSSGQYFTPCSATALMLNIIFCICCCLYVVIISSLYHSDKVVFRKSVCNDTQNLTIPDGTIQYATLPSVCTRLSNSLSICGYSLMVENSLSKTPWRLCYEFSNETEIRFLYRLVKYCVLRADVTEAICSNGMVSVKKDKSFLFLTKESSPIAFYSVLQTIDLHQPIALFAIFNMQCTLSLRELMHAFAVLLS